MNLTYDNTSYWREIHGRLAGTLRAVGHPGLSEKLNELKYESEADSMLRALGLLVESPDPSNVFSVLDLGAGTGYWSELVAGRLERRGMKVKLTALDISPQALETVRSRRPDAELVEADLKTATPGPLAGKFDLVVAGYCLHHLIRLDEFLNALRFAGVCVNPGGGLIVMDPVLSLHYSPFDACDSSSFGGNGVPRRLKVHDDVLERLGLDRQAVLPAVSFVLNGPVHARSRLGYLASLVAWKLLCRLHVSGAATRGMAPVWRALDRLLKRTGLGGSSSVGLWLKARS